MKSCFCFKKGRFIGPQNQRFQLKKGVFLAQNPRKGGTFQAWVRAWYTFWSGVEGPGFCPSQWRCTAVTASQISCNSIVCSKYIHLTTEKAHKLRITAPLWLHTLIIFLFSTKRCSELFTDTRYINPNLLPSNISVSDAKGVHNSYLFVKAHLIS